MKHIITLLGCALLLGCPTAFCQQPEVATKVAPAAKATPAAPAVPAAAVTPAFPQTPPPPTSFNLDFSGGTPKQLVAAVEKSVGRPVNVIVPDEFAETPLPALRMRGVNVPQLFSALEQAGRFSKDSKIYGFVTDGPKSEEAVWTFFAVKRSQRSEKVCRFYSLSPFIENGQTVDDITTAIQTGWKMLGEKEGPTMNFHEETKLLIAVGEPERLETIDAVLHALRSSRGVPSSPTPSPVSATPTTPAASPETKQ